MSSSCSALVDSAWRIPKPLTLLSVGLEEPLRATLIPFPTGAPMSTIPLPTFLAHVIQRSIPAFACSGDTLDICSDAGTDDMYSTRYFFMFLLHGKESPLARPIAFDSVARVKKVVRAAQVAAQDIRAKLGSSQSIEGPTFNRRKTTMKLYFKPGACSLASHIVLCELGVPFELDRVDTKAGKTASGKDFRAINPKGYVPTLHLDDGTVLTEGAAILQYLADRKPEAGLSPKADSLERYQLQEWLNYIATELHKGFGGPLFSAASDETKRAIREGYSKKLDFLSEHLKARHFLLGERFTVADAYLFTVLTWSNGRGIELERWPVLKQYFDRIAARPAVRAARQAEGLL